MKKKQDEKAEEDVKKEKDGKKEPVVKFKLYGGKQDIVIYVVSLIIVLGCIFSPNMYWVTTAKWTNWDETNTANVKSAMGEENTEERFRLYFQYYNVVHELGHGLLKYNKGVKLHVVDEEQLVNDFAVAYWNYYGEPEKMAELYDIVTYAVENVGDNYKNGVDYIELGKEHSSYNDIDNDFFNFNDYGWFQFSSVKHSIEQNKSLEEVLKEMGFKDFKLTEKTVLEHKVINEQESTRIVNEAAQNFNDWGLYFPKVYQTFDDDPNMNYSKRFKDYFGIFGLLVNE